MTDQIGMPGRAAAEALARQAHTEVSCATARLSRRLAPHPDAGQIPAPGVALRAARQLELAARGEVRAHIRRARESGLSWHQIGELLGFGPLAAGGGATAGDYAFDYTIGPRTAAAWFNPPVFGWSCPACGHDQRPRPAGLPG